MGAFPRKLKNGVKWRYQGYYKGQRYTGPAIYDSKRDAEEAERVYIAGLRGDSLQSLMKSYLDHLRVRKTNVGYQKHSGRVIQRVIDFMEDPGLPVRSMAKKHVQGFIDKDAAERFDNGQSNHSVNSALRILKAFFNYGINTKGIEMTNPAVHVKPMPLDDEPKYIPTDEELKRLREKLDNEEALLVAFCAETGCRINEALRLTAKDVKDDRVILRTRKAKNSNLTPRIIPRPYCFTDECLPENGERIFKRWKSQPRFLEKTVNKLMKMTLGEFIGFPEETEEEPKGYALSNYFGWHNLRHKAASEWHHSGMPLIEIMNRLGHSNIETTKSLNCIPARSET